MTDANTKQFEKAAAKRVKDKVCFYECKQILNHLGRNKFWGSLRKNNVMHRPKKVRYFMSHEVFGSYGETKFKKKSRKRIEEVARRGIKRYEFDAVDAKIFYKLVRAEYCYESNGKSGYYYMDNIKIRYNLNEMNIEIEYVVVQWDKNDNHGRARPLYW